MDGIADAFAFAKAKKKTVAVTNRNSGLLVAISAVEVGFLTDEEIEKKRREAEERKSAAQIGATKLAEIDAEIAKIRGIQSWEEVPDLAENLRRLLVLRQKIAAAGDDAFQQSLSVAQLIDKISKTDPKSKEDVARVFREVVEAGRGKLFSSSDANKLKNGENSPKRAIFFGEFAIISCPSEFYEEGISPADKKIFFELYQLVKRWYSEKEKAIKERMANLKGRGNPDLCGLANGRSGLYRIYVSERRDKNGKVVSAEGAGLVEVINLNKADRQPFFVVRVVDGAGSFGWMEAVKGKWIPVAAVRTGRVLKDKTLPQEYETSTKLARTLNWACKSALVLTIIRSR